MPIENERKFVLHDPDGALERQLRGRSGVSEALLRQAYLDSSGVRIREIVSDGETRAFFTFKRSVASAVVEIETAISAEDFERLWSLRRETLVKVRYHFTAGDCGWDIDFFKDGASAAAPTYFALAEVEMPASWTTAPPAPAFLQPFIVHCVANGDERYTSKRLASIPHARTMMDELLRAT